MGFINWIYKAILWVSLCLANILYCYPIALYYACKKRKLCPMITDEILFKSATKLAEEIRNRHISSQEVVSAYIKRCKAVNPILNAIIEDRFEEALKEAKKVDELILRNEYSVEKLAEIFPLLGVPVTLKGSISISGLLCTAGRRYSNPDSMKSLTDAEMVKQVKEAGGIILLVSSTPELCESTECYNKIIGVTNSPFDSRRTPGGSSGGEAALISSAASVVGIGSDIAGSIRIPSFYCGIFGHKPSGRIVSVEGHYPDSPSREIWTKVFVLGPMTRYAEDLTLMMNVVTKPQIRDELLLNDPVDVKSLKIYYMFEGDESCLRTKVDSEIRDAMYKVVEHFSKNGNETEKIVINEFKYSEFIAFMSLLLIDGIDDIFDGNQKKSGLLESFRLITGTSNHTAIPIFYVTHRKSVLSKLSPKQKDNLIKLQDNLYEKFQKLLKSNAVFLYPTLPHTSTYHDQVFGAPFDCSYCGIFNVLGLPSTNCPIGISSQGLPIGIQVVGGINNDRLTIAVAKEIEKAFGGWIKPPASKKL